MLESSLKTHEVVRMYSVPIRDERVEELITWYTRMLQKAVDIIWENIVWEYRSPEIFRRGGRISVELGYKVKVLRIPADRKFKKMLRDTLLTECSYAKHWIDAVIRTAYSIIESWRKRYLKGEARKVKPRIKRRFARCKITLMKVDYESKSVRITLKPGEYLEISWRGKWFSRRVEGWMVGEAILKDDRVLIPFKKSEVYSVERVVAWDSNELSLDGYSPGIGFIKVDLRYLQSLKIVYERKKAIAQSIGKRKLFEKYARREKNGEKDFINKLVKQLTTLLPNAVHVVENLEKKDLVARGRTNKERRKRNARTPWETIHRKLSEKALVVKISPRNTSRTCPRCRCVVKTQVGRVFKCPRCSLEMDRQKLASLNIYLKYTRMWGFPHGCEPNEGELWVGVTLNEWRPMTWAPMKGAPRSMKPRVDINQYETQTPYYIIVRHPNVGLGRPWESIDKALAERLLTIAEDVVEYVGRAAGFR
ncbi:MAG: zinc ribbon domain-containing protein [Desulfurococcaceae archaeon]